MADMTVFPFFERLMFLKGSDWDDSYRYLDPEKTCPNLLNYTSAFRELDIF